MRTTDQSPSRTFHVTVCVPVPKAETAQNCCAVGGPCGGPPAIGRYPDTERIDLDVLDVRVSDASEVLGDSHLRPDADEERLRAGWALAADLNLAEPVVCSRASRAHQHRPQAACASARRSTLQTARLASSGSRPLALGPVSPEQEAAACQQDEPEQNSDAAENNEDDAARAHYQYRSALAQTDSRRATRRQIRPGSETR